MLLYELGVLRLVGGRKSAKSGMSFFPFCLKQSTKLCISVESNGNEGCLRFEKINIRYIDIDILPDGLGRG